MATMPAMVRLAARRVSPSTVGAADGNSRPALVEPIGSAHDGDMRRVRWPVIIGAAVLALVPAACDDNSTRDSTGASTTEEVTGTTTATTPATAAPTVTEPPVTGRQEYPTTTVHMVPDDCDAGAVLALVDQRIADARLASGSDWRDDTAGVAFDDRTNTAEEFRYRMGLDCMARLAQTTESGAERLLLAAWTGDRAAYVVQATDTPSTPYEPEQRFQLFVEMPYGEWLEDQFVWAATLQGGESVVIGTVDTVIGVAAKSWLREIPRFEDLEPTLEAERFAIDALVQAGARNVSVAEPAGYDWEIAAIQFITPLGLHLIATVAPDGLFDPASELVEGEMVVESVQGVDVYVTTGSPDSYAVASVGWICGDYVWFIDSAWGTVDELLDWATVMIDSVQCGTD
jgi:hypothetical protein